MNNTKSKKKLTFKKSVVRNPEQTKPKTVVILQPELPGSSGASRKSSVEPSVVSGNEAILKDPTDEKSKLESPKLNSALRIVKAIESVENVKLKNVKHISNVEMKKRLVVDEKASKQVNIPYNQHVYKDLIPLCTKSRPPTLPAKEIVMHKNKEPVLSDFFTPKILPEYSFQAPVESSNKTLSKQFDGLRLYRTMRNWN